MEGQREHTSVECHGSHCRRFIVRQKWHACDSIEGVPGLFLKSYGGPGSVTTSSIRGMGAEHTLVLVDGQRYNNARTVRWILELCRFRMLREWRCLRGGFSSIYGTDALGGIINIVTRRPGTVSRVRGEVLTGSYGMHGGQLSAELPLGQIGLLLSARRETGRGDYEFKFQNGRSSSTLRAGMPTMPSINCRCSRM